MKKVIVLFLVSLLLCSTAFAANPFVKPKKAPPKKIVKEVNYPDFLRPTMVFIRKSQAQIKDKMSIQTRKLKEEKSPKLLFSVLFLAFLYGLIHAAGPGHGKFITASYFLSRDSSLKKGVIFGNLLSFMHTLSAVIFVLVVYYVLKFSFMSSEFEVINLWMIKISYSLVILIGAGLFIKSLVDMKNSNHSHGICCQATSGEGVVPVSLAVGLIPCPGTIIILLFSISLGILYVGLLSVVAMALGMAVTISIIGVLTILARKVMLKSISSQSHLLDTLHHIMSSLGAFFIMVLGILLLLANV